MTSEEQPRDEQQQKNRRRWRLRLDSLKDKISVQWPLSGTPTLVGTGFIAVVAVVGWWFFQQQSQVEVPNLIGMPRAAAEAQLKDSGLKVRGTYEEFSNQPAGTVLRTDPLAGTKLARDKGVSLLLASPTPTQPPEPSNPFRNPFQNPFQNPAPGQSQDLAPGQVLVPVPGLGPVPGTGPAPDPSRDPPPGPDDPDPKLPAPIHVSPADGSVLTHYPRNTTLIWRPVTGAARYSVEVECLGCAAVGVWSPWASTTTDATNYSFTWVGDNDGRWRVTAIAADGTQGDTSVWWYFTYDTTGAVPPG